MHGDCKIWRTEKEMGHGSCQMYIVRKEICFSCYKHHLKIIGCYVDGENIPKERFLGYSFKSALQRVNHVKSFL